MSWFCHTKINFDLFLRLLLKFLMEGDFVLIFKRNGGSHYNLNSCFETDITCCSLRLFRPRHKIAGNVDDHCTMNILCNDCSNSCGVY